MPKNKPNKGLLKRIRMTKTGKVKMGRAYGRHRRSHKTGDLLRSYRQPNYAHASDLKRIAGMLHARVIGAGASRAATKDAAEA